MASVNAITDGGKSVLVMLSSPIASRMAGVSRFAREHGWHLLFQDRIPSHSFDWDADGVIATVRNDPHTLAFLRRLSGKGVPIVDLTYDVPQFKCSRVMVDHVAVGRLAGEHFDERNIRSRIFLSIDWGNVQERLWRGFGGGSPNAGKWCFAQERPRTRWDDWGAVSRWLAGKLATAKRPFGVLTYAQSESVIFLQAALHAGIAVPDEVAIIAGNDDPVMLESQPVPISAVDAGTERGAYEAASLLQCLMDGASAPPAPVELPPCCVVARKSTDATVAEDPLVRAAIALFVTGLRNGVNIEGVARALGVSRNTLGRRISAELGRTASAELHRQRLMLARRLLENPGNKVEYVARMAGFSSASHLGTAMRAATGMSPMEFRRWPRSVAAADDVAMGSADGSGRHGGRPSH